MIDLKFLEQQLQGPAAQQLGSDDPTINEMLRLAERNEFLAAAAEAQKLWEQNVYDVRTLGCFLCGVFVEQGLCSLPKIFDAILRALTLNWEYLGPFERKQRLCDVSLRWLFTTLKSQVDFHHRNKSSDWDRWNEGWTLALHRQTAERCVQLGVLLDDVLPGAQSRGRLLVLQSTLEDVVRPSSETAGWKAKMQNATQVPPPPLPPLPDEESGSSSGSSSPSSDSSSGSGSDDDSSTSSSDDDSSTSSSDDDASASSASKSSAQSSASKSSAASSSSKSSPGKSADSASKPADDRPPSSSDSSPSPKKKTQSAQSGAASKESAPPSIGDPLPKPVFPPQGPTGESLTLPLSPALRGLLSQLDVFLKLMQGKQLTKAAILYRQIQQSIEHFAPLIFLPSLFGPYYATLAKHGPLLATALKQPADFRIDALVELCRVDLALFFETEIDD